MFASCFSIDDDAFTLLLTLLLSLSDTSLNPIFRNIQESGIVCKQRLFHRSSDPTKVGSGGLLLVAAADWQVRVHEGWTRLEEIYMDLPLCPWGNLLMGDRALRWFWTLLVLCLFSWFLWMKRPRLLELCSRMLIFLSVRSACQTSAYLSAIYVTWPETSTSCVSLKHTHTYFVSSDSFTWVGLSVWQQRED